MHSCFSTLSDVSHVHYRTVISLLSASYVTVSAGIFYIFLNYVFSSVTTPQVHRARKKTKNTFFVVVFVVL
jgi:hypothetical protein